MSSDSHNRTNHNQSRIRSQSDPSPARPLQPQSENARNLPTDDHKTFQGFNYWDQDKADT